MASTGSRLQTWLIALLPLILLGLALWVFVRFAPLYQLIGDQPPIEELSVTRTELRPGEIVIHIVNGGPEPVTVAQVQVDEAYWGFTIEPESLTIERLERARVTVPYAWVQGEAHALRIVTSTGLTFDHAIEVATASPEADSFHWLIFGLIGLLVGVIPVGLGLMWFPLLQRLSRSGLRFMLALTIGLLIFLLVDTVLEGLEIAAPISEVFNAVPLIFFVALLSFVVLIAVGNRPKVRDRSTEGGRVWIATAIALGIGLHNLGEGMAIGAATALGEAALGSFLVIGFALHNITEGVGIGAPMARDTPGIRRLILLALLAGGPAIPGVWIGGFSYSPLLAVLFLAIGAGAILQVIYEVGRLVLTSDSRSEVSGRSLGPVNWINIGGVTAGLVIMYATALLVV